MRVKGDEHSTVPPPEDVTRAMYGLNGLPVYHVLQGSSDARYIPLPEGLWRSCGTCNCTYCGGKEGFWDTLGVMGRGDGPARTWTLHAPELHKSERRRIAQFERL